MDESVLRERMRAALRLRQRLFKGASTTVYRLLNDGGDRLPGVILDRYGDFGVARITGPDTRALVPRIYHAALDLFDLKGIYEKGPPQEGFHPGRSRKDRPVLGETAPDAIPVREGGMLLEARLNEGARTGIYPDQRENRELLASLIQGRRVLNTFSYTGAFSVHAALNGAEETVSVDLSRRVLDWSMRNFRLNGLDPGRHRHVKADVLDYLRLAAKKGLSFGLAILDPVTFSTSRQGTFRAVKDWPGLLRGALRVLEKNGLLAISCNTRQLTEERMRRFLDQAARAEGCRVKIEAVRGLPGDFPVDPRRPGMQYLKFILGIKENEKT